MKIVIRFKSGFELPVTCEEFLLSKSVITGEIDSYNIKGITDNKPLFFRSVDVECVYRVMEAEHEEVQDNS